PHAQGRAHRRVGHGRRAHRPPRRVLDDVRLADRPGRMSGVRRADIGLRSARGPILLSVMLTTGLAALDVTVLSTAVPTIVADLGGFQQFPWLFSIYVLASAVTVPVYSKLADTLGRK